LVDAPTTLVPLPALDEGGNWIDVRWGPLTKMGDYHIDDASLAADAGTSTGVSHDFDGQGRPQGAGYDIGADEVASNRFPVGSASPNPVAFGLQRVLTGSQKTITVSNSGTAPLVISNVVVSGRSGSGFIRTILGAGSCGTSATVAVGSSCTINVTFLPTSSGAKTGTVTISSNDPANSTMTVSLTGTAYQIALNNSALSFTYTPNARTKTVTVQNWGSSAVTMSAPTVTGTDASAFAASSNCGSSLAAAFVAGLLPRTCTVTVTFTSASNTPAGGLHATLNVNDADPSAPQQVALTGTRP
jgi:hypothetical protein